MRRSRPVHALKEKSGPNPKAGVSPNRYIARCGEEVIDPDGMTAWESEVTCPDCIYLRRVRHDEIVRAHTR